mmetsp:Transcript_26211/g.45102  ORF Transcript_26211/g.45102 Transcript_26211/m.45102 type:complete len:288 (-) Transcript_26211:15-878(-)
MAGIRFDPYVRTRRANNFVESKVTKGLSLDFVLMSRKRQLAAIFENTPSPSPPASPCYSPSDLHQESEAYIESLFGDDRKKRCRDLEEGKLTVLANIFEPTPSASPRPTLADLQTTLEAQECDTRPLFNLEHPLDGSKHLYRRHSQQGRLHHPPLPERTIQSLTTTPTVPVRGPLSFALHITMGWDRAHPVKAVTGAPRLASTSSTPGTPSSPPSQLQTTSGMASTVPSTLACQPAASVPSSSSTRPPPSNATRSVPTGTAGKNLPRPLAVSGWISTPCCSTLPTEQ